MCRGLVTFVVWLFVMSTATGGTIKSQTGWVVIDTPYPFSKLVDRLEAAVNAEHMNIVNTASASEGAKAAGVAIPGNRVIGVFRNDFARRLLDASVTAGIEAPIRIYVTENSDHTATLSYKKPTAVFASYTDEGKHVLKELAAELDDIFKRIAELAAKEKCRGSGLRVCR
ncbi:hypothetical protein ES707_15002 [subsurface metagenome]